MYYLFLPDLHLSTEVPDSIEQMTASSDDWNTTASMMDLAKRRSQRPYKAQSAETASGNNNHYIEEDNNFGIFIFHVYYCIIIEKAIDSKFCMLELIDDA